jgi:tetratricopeptide (TPR) repeat protein
VIREATELAKLGKLGPSLALLSTALAEDPSDPELLYARGLTLLDWGRPRESLEDLRAAEARGFSGVGLHINLAQVCHVVGFAEEAERRLREAIALDGSVVAAHRGLGVVLQAAKRFDEAAQSYERACELEPSRLDCLYDLASCRLDQGDGPRAEALARKALAIDGEHQAKFLALLGVALALLGRYEAAMEAFEHAEQAEACAGGAAEIFIMHAFQLLAFGRVSEALALYARYLPSSVDPGAHANCGLALLTGGLLRKGWPLYEFRWSNERLSSTRPRFAAPEWDGQDLKGKTLLLWAEQGVGDTVQFARFAQLLKGKGASVVLHAPKRLSELAKRFRDIDRVVSSVGEVSAGVDYYIPTLSLPGVLGIDDASLVADVPYLTVDPEKRESWRKRMAPDARLKVGLVWAGNPSHERDRYRSMALSQLDSLFGVEGVQFYSLQKERRIGDVAHLPDGVELVDLAPGLEDFCDTAAAIGALDLLITVDTAVAHIAGALAKPVWVMLPAGADFRWLTERNDSPWYPTMRLFRQRRLGEWESVTESIRGALLDAVSARGACDLPRALLPSAGPRGDSMLAAAAQLIRLEKLCRICSTRYGMIQYHEQHELLARSLRSYGEWLQPQLDLLGKLLRPGATVVEVHSGIGVHTLGLAALIGPDGYLLAYEADPRRRRMLSENVRVNASKNVCTVMQRILIGEEGRSANDVLSDAGVVDEASSISDTIDDLLLKRLDLLKLNEGADARQILAGAADTLWRLRPFVFIGLDDDADLTALAEHVKSFSYRVWRVRVPYFVPENFKRCEVDLTAGAVQPALLAVPEETQPHAELDRFEEI